jgi:dihydroflavonol-4-reductase
VTVALVIGGTGFIGLNVVDALLEKGATVRVTRRRRSITAFVRKRPVELVEASLEDPEALRRAMQGCDEVYFTAAHYPRYSIDLQSSLEEGVRGVLNVCQAALDVGVPRLIYTSSIATLEAVPGRPSKESDIPAEMPRGSVYRAVKWAMEREVEKAVERGLNAVTLLPGGCVGPWDVRAGTGGFIVGAVSGKLPWWVDGLAHVTSVCDVAKAHVAAARHAAAGARYCIVGCTRPMGELLDLIVRRYGGQMPAERLEPEAARVRADQEESRAAPRKERVPFPREMVDIITGGHEVNSQRAKNELGITATPLESTLDSAYDWFVRFGYLRNLSINRGGGNEWKPPRGHYRQSSENMEKS